MVKMPHWPIQMGKIDVASDLTRIRAMLSAVGNPELRLPQIVHVTGTNGKGSTIAYLQSILECSNYSVHKYISPHLINFNERIVLCGQEIDDSMLFQLGENCRVALEAYQGSRYSFFEATTVMAFLAFSSIPADILLLEVGMGGRLDPTNVISSNILSIITPISLDHTEFLGESIDLIAKEKAGIIKHGCTCLVGWQYKEAMNIIKDYCAQIGSRCIAYGEDWDFIVSKEGFYVQIIDFQNDSDHLLLGPYKQSLIGIHQILNAATAVVAAYILQHSLYSKINHMSIAQGLSTTVWPARMERITNGKLFDLVPNNWEIWLDGAHNPNGAEMLAASIKKIPKNLPLYLIHGRTARHNIKIFLEHFIDHEPELICCLKVKSELKGEEAEVIQKNAIEMGFKAISCKSIDEAVAVCVYDAKKKSLAKDGARIVICGSLYLAGDVLSASK